VAADPGAINSAGAAYVHAVSDNPNSTLCTVGTECTSGFCVDGVCCDTTCAGGTDDCRSCLIAHTGVAKGKCVHVVASANDVCRPAASGRACDQADACDGTSDSCPLDRVKSMGTVCRPAVGICDRQETCDGSTADCPVNILKSAGTQGKPPGVNATCDPDDFCDGICTACPANFAPYGTSCGTSMSCKGIGRCL
jgi:hypothetical protein